MKITSLVKQKRNENRYNIYVDNEFAFSASLEDVVKCSIREGQEFSDEDLKNLIELCEGSKAYEYALFILAKRNYTSSEVEKKLKLKEYSPATVAKVIEKLKLYGIINDDRFIEKYIADGQKIKKHGIRKILYNLENKGVKKSSLENINKDDNIEFNNAYFLAQKKLKLIKDKDNQKEKIYRHLVSKGYEYEIVKKVVVRLFSESGSDFE